MCFVAASSLGSSICACSSLAFVSAPLFEEKSMLASWSLTQKLMYAAAVAWLLQLFGIEKPDVNRTVPGEAPDGSATVVSCCPALAPDSAPCACPSWLPGLLSARTLPLAMKLCSVWGASAAFSCAVVVSPPLRNDSHRFQNSTRVCWGNATLLPLNMVWP